MQNFSGRKLKKCKNESLKCHQSVRKKVARRRSKKIVANRFFMVAVVPAEKVFLQKLLFQRFGPKF